MRIGTVAGAPSSSPPANVADITQTAELLYGEETQVHANAGYTGVAKRAEIVSLDWPID